jgi:UDP-N-acetylmuramoyl-tripeptide--D-alanyl-D-alanine ligase
VIGIAGAGDRVPVQIFLEAALGPAMDIHSAVQDQPSAITIHCADEVWVERDGTKILPFEVESICSGLDGTTFTLSDASGSWPVSLKVLGEQWISPVAAAILVARELSIDVGSAIARLEKVTSAGHWRMSATSRAGVTIINDAHGATRQSMASALRALAQFTVDERRSVAVLGPMTTDSDTRVEDHDAIGRLVVRLNIGKLVAVGNEARHIQSAAGLEGSWDGESVIVASSDQAYDLLREEIREGDVVLVKAAESAGLGSLGDRLSEAYS